MLVEYTNSGTHEGFLAHSPTPALHFTGNCTHTPANLVISLLVAARVIPSLSHILPNHLMLTHRQCLTLPLFIKSHTRHPRLQFFLMPRASAIKRLRYIHHLSPSALPELFALTFVLYQSPTHSITAEHFSPSKPPPAPPLPLFSSSLLPLSPKRLSYVQPPGTLLELFALTSPFIKAHTQHCRSRFVFLTENLRDHRHHRCQFSLHQSPHTTNRPASFSFTTAAAFERLR